MAIYSRNEQGQFVPLPYPTLKGEKGKDGVTPNFTIGNVTTLPSDQQATVVIRGDKENPIIDFGIPKGQDGTGTGNQQQIENMINELLKGVRFDEVTPIHIAQVGELKFLAFDKGESFELNGNTWVKCEGQAIPTEYSGLSDLVKSDNLPTNNSPVGYTYICAK